MEQHGALVLRLQLLCLLTKTEKGSLSKQHVIYYVFDFYRSTACINRQQLL